jgi:hypothetical protein
MRVLRLLVCGTCIWAEVLVLSASYSAQPSHERYATHLTIQGLMLGENTLQDARKKLGEAPLLRRGQGGAAANVLCYRVEKDAQVRLVLEASAAGGGADLSGFRLISMPTAEFRERDCSLSSRLIQPIRTNGGLRLGLSREAVENLLGQPKRRDGARETFVSKSETKIKGITFDVQTIIEITFDHLKASDIGVYHTVTS